MARVVEVFEGAGFAGAWTYANSGNVVLEATDLGADLEGTSGHDLERTFGFEITTFARAASLLRQLVRKIET